MIGSPVRVALLRRAPLRRAPLAGHPSPGTPPPQRETLLRHRPESPYRKQHEIVEYLVYSPRDSAARLSAIEAARRADSAERFGDPKA